MQPNRHTRASEQLNVNLIIIKGFKQQSIAKWRKDSNVVIATDKISKPKAREKP